MDKKDQLSAFLYMSLRLEGDVMLISSNFFNCAMIMPTLFLDFTKNLYIVYLFAIESCKMLFFELRHCSPK